MRPKLRLKTVRNGKIDACICSSGSDRSPNMPKCASSMTEPSSGAANIAQAM